MKSQIVPISTPYYNKRIDESKNNNILDDSRLDFNETKIHDNINEYNDKRQDNNSMQYKNIKYEIPLYPKETYSTLYAAINKLRYIKTVDEYLKQVPYIYANSNINMIPFKMRSRSTVFKTVRLNIDLVTTANTEYFLIVNPLDLNNTVLLTNTNFVSISSYSLASKLGSVFSKAAVCQTFFRLQNLGKEFSTTDNKIIADVGYFPASNNFKFYQNLFDNTTETSCSTNNFDLFKPLAGKISMKRPHFRIINSPVSSNGDLGSLIVNFIPNLAIELMGGDSIAPLGSSIICLNGTFAGLYSFLNQNTDGTVSTVVTLNSTTTSMSQFVMTSPVTHVTSAVAGTIVILTPPPSLTNEDVVLIHLQPASSSTTLSLALQFNCALTVNTRNQSEMYNQQPYDHNLIDLIIKEDDHDHLLVEEGPTKYASLLGDLLGKAVSYVPFVGNVLKKGVEMADSIVLNNRDNQPYFKNASLNFKNSEDFDLPPKYAMMTNDPDLNINENFSINDAFEEDDTLYFDGDICFKFHNSDEAKKHGYVKNTFYVGGRYIKFIIDRRAMMRESESMKTYMRKLAVNTKDRNFNNVTLSPLATELKKMNKIVKRDSDPTHCGPGSFTRMSDCITFFPVIDANTAKVNRLAFVKEVVDIMDVPKSYHRINDIFYLSNAIDEVPIGLSEYIELVPIENVVDKATVIHVLGNYEIIQGVEKRYKIKDLSYGAALLMVIVGCSDFLTFSGGVDWATLTPLKMPKETISAKHAYCTETLFFCPPIDTYNAIDTFLPFVMANNIVDPHLIENYISLLRWGRSAPNILGIENSYYKHREFTVIAMDDFDVAKNIMIYLASYSSFPTSQTLLQRAGKLERVEDIGYTFTFAGVKYLSTETQPIIPAVVRNLELYDGIYSNNYYKLGEDIINSIGSDLIPSCKDLLKLVIDVETDNGVKYYSTRHNWEALNAKVGNYKTKGQLAPVSLFDDINTTIALAARYLDTCGLVTPAVSADVEFVFEVPFKVNLGGAAINTVLTELKNKNQLYYPFTAYSINSLKTYLKDHTLLLNLDNFVVMDSDGNKVNPTPSDSTQLDYYYYGKPNAFGVKYHTTFKDYINRYRTDFDNKTRIESKVKVIAQNSIVKTNMFIKNEVPLNQNTSYQKDNLQNRGRKMSEESKKIKSNTPSPKVLRSRGSSGLSVGSVKSLKVSPKVNYLKNITFD